MNALHRYLGRLHDTVLSRQGAQGKISSGLGAQMHRLRPKAVLE